MPGMFFWDTVYLSSKAKFAWESNKGKHLDALWPATSFESQHNYNTQTQLNDPY